MLTLGFAHHLPFNRNGLLSQGVSVTSISHISIRQRSYYVQHSSYLQTSRNTPQKSPLQTTLLCSLLPVKLKTKPKIPSKPIEFHVTGDSLTSTPAQHVLVLTYFLLSLTSFTNILIHTHGARDCTGLAFGMLVGYLFADFGTGIYHWAVDNYGSKDTPLFGYQIEAFQGHHKFPWTITARSLSNNLYRLTFPTIPQLAILSIMNDILPISIQGFWLSALTFIVLSQEFHKWAHMTKVSGFIGILQRIGVIIDKKEHCLHHLKPYGVKYCIVSGVWNELLDRSKFFRRLEAGIYRWCGVEPASWKLDAKLKKQALSL